jgi:hypothetical protein
MNADENLLDNHQNKCRCCFKELSSDESKHKISKIVQTRFFELTQIELKKSINLSDLICDLCNNDLEGFSSLRRDYITKQEKLYEFYFGNKSGQDRELMTIDDESFYVTSEVRKEFETIDLKPMIVIEPFEPLVKLEKEETSILAENFPIPEHFYDYSTNPETILKEDHSIKSEDEGNYQECQDEENDEQEINLNTKSRVKFQATKFQSDIQLPNWKKPLGYKVRCPICHQTKTVNGLKYHVMRSHSFDDKFNCSRRNCKFTTKNVEAIIEHVRACKGVKIANDKTPKICPFCGISVILLGAHINIMHNQKGIEYFCHHCPFVANSKVKIKKHMRKHISKETKMMFIQKCDQCGKMLNNRDALLLHIKVVHGRQDERHVCPRRGCGKVFKRIISLQYHDVSAHIKV